MWIYSDYLTVKSDFVPVFSEDADVREPKGWKSFIPHSGMLDLLPSLIKALERGSPSDRRSLWIHGAYGTGKTFAAFVLKHLLEDSLDEVEEYLTHYEMLRPLWPRINALRERGRYLVVYRSSSAHITSSLKMLVEVQEGIKKRLVERGLNAGIETTLYETILDRLTNPASTFDWTKAFEKHKGKFLDFPSEDSVVSKLLDGNPDPDLADRIAAVLDQEKFVVLDSPQTVKTWCREVIQKNDLKGILFIWDEFTDFFVNNVALSDIQELAHASSDMPFYLLLVTHRSPEYFQRIDRQTMDRMLERFHNIHFEMEAVTAYQLVGNTIEVQPEHEADWEDKKESLWSEIHSIASNLFDQEASSRDFKALIPIHPYTAFCLSTLSRQFSSSQRTLFRFLKEDGKGSFQEFIREYPSSDDWRWLTADMLWDYFFGDETENEELRDRVRTIVNYFRSRSGSLDDPVKMRLYKTIMLLNALSKEMPGEDRIAPKRSILNLAFKGTLMRGEIEKLTEELCSNHYVNAVPVGYDDVEFTVPLHSIDQKMLNDIRRNLDETLSFDSKISATEDFGKALSQSFRLGGSQFCRHNFQTISSKYLENRRNKVEPIIEPYQIGMVAVVSLEEYELNRAEDLCNQCSKKSDQTCYVTIQVPFGQKRWENWKEQTAHYKYCEKVGDYQNADVYRQHADDLVGEWVDQVKHAKNVVFFKSRKSHFMGLQGYERQFDEIIEEVFPAGPERISHLGTLYTQNPGKAAAEIGLGIRDKVTQQYRELVDNLRSFEQHGFSSNDPNHPLSRMKQRVEDLFKDRSEVNLNEIWKAMQKPPYGLFASPIGMVLMGFFLKEFCQGRYWSDGISCFSLSLDKLAELLDNVRKKKKGYDDYVIREMTQEDEEFCKLVRQVFQLPEEESSYPDEARKALRNRLQTVGYPLWSLKYLLKEEEASLKAIINSLGDFLKASSEDPQVSDVITHIVTLSRDSSIDKLRSLTKKEKFESGMLDFIKQHHPSLQMVMDANGLDARWATGRLRSLMNEEVWLWNESHVTDILSEVHADAALLRAINRLCGASKKQLDQLIEFLKTQWLPEKTKLPLFILADVAFSDLGQIFLGLHRLITGEAMGEQEKRDLASGISEYIHDVRKTLDSASDVLLQWIEKKLGMKLNYDDVDEVLESLPNLLIETDRGKIRKEIATRCETLARARLAREVRERWNEISGSESPRAWSEGNRIPVSWMLEGPDFENLFDVLDRPEIRNKEELLQAVDFMEAHQDEIGALCNSILVNDQFIKIVAPDYGNLIKDSVHIDALKEHLFETLGKNVMEWPSMVTELKETISNWIKEFYSRYAYQKVVHDIDSMPDYGAKVLLRDMAVDPIVGSLYLKKRDGQQE